MYALFAQLGSARQVMMTLRERGLRLPRRKAGARRITWAEASYPAVHDFLTNPAYAGAFAFGKTTTRTEIADGKKVTRHRQLPQDQWEVLIPGHHPGYLGWDAYQDNQARLRANYKAPRGDGGGAARKGAALLSGLLRCGKCGRMMQVGYSGHGGDAPRYVCGRGTQLYGTPPCQSIGGVCLHRAVLEQLFQVLQPASLQATAHAMADAEQRHREQVAAFETALERARFEADRAMRKHDEVEPGNRLVARTLEARLEERLAALRRAEAALAAARTRHPVQLTSEELAWLQRAGADVRAVFGAPATTNPQRKQLIRTVISEITLTIDRQARTCDALIAWQGTATTQVTVPLPKRGAGAITTGEDILTLIRRLAAHYNDTTIAQILGRQQRRTATGLAWTRDRVSGLRRSHGIPHCPDPDENVTASGAGCRHGQHPADRTAPGRGQGHHLPMAAGRLHHRRAAHLRRPVADPRRPSASRPHPPRRPRRLAAPRPGRQGARNGPPDRVAQGPARPAQRRLRHRRTPQRPAYPGRTRSAWTV